MIKINPTPTEKFIAACSVIPGVKKVDYSGMRSQYIDIWYYDRDKKDLKKELNKLQKEFLSPGFIVCLHNIDHRHSLPF